MSRHLVPFLLILTLLFPGVSEAPPRRSRTWARTIQYCDMAVLSAAAIGFTLYLASLPSPDAGRDDVPPPAAREEFPEGREEGDPRFEPPGIQVRVDDRGFFHLDLRDATGLPVHEWEIVLTDVPAWIVVEKTALHGKAPQGFDAAETPLPIKIVYETPHGEIVPVSFLLRPLP